MLELGLTAIWRGFELYECLLVTVELSVNLADDDQDVSKPFVQLRLGVRNPDTETVEHVAFTLTVDKFKVLLHGMLCRPRLHVVVYFISLVVTYSANTGWFLQCFAVL